MELTWADLITIPGAAAAAVTLTKMVTAWAQLPKRHARMAALAFGIAILEAATGVTSGWSLPAIFAAIPAGISAGLTAIAAYDSWRSGFDYRVTEAD